MPYGRLGGEIFSAFPAEQRQARARGYGLPLCSSAPIRQADARSLAATSQPARVRRIAPRLHRGALSVSLLRRRIGADALRSNYTACVATGRSARSCPVPGLLWNATANVLITCDPCLPAGTLNVNELLVLMPPVLLATLLDERRYLPRVCRC